MPQGSLFRPLIFKIFFPPIAEMALQFEIRTGFNLKTSGLTAAALGPARVCFCPALAGRNIKQKIGTVFGAAF